MFVRDYLQRLDRRRFVTPPRRSQTGKRAREFPLMNILVNISSLRRVGEDVSKPPFRPTPFSDVGNQIELVT